MLFHLLYIDQVTFTKNITVHSRCRIGSCWYFASFVLGYNFYSFMTAFLLLKMISNKFVSRIGFRNMQVLAFNFLQV